MSIVDRHKKPGGFRKLVNSLETTPPERRTKIIAAMKQEDPEFMTEIEGCLFHFEEFEAVNDMVLCEILFALKNEMKVLAVALHNCPNENLVNKFMKNLGKQQFEYREQLGMLRGVLAREQTAARFRIIEKARELEHTGKFILKRYSERYRDEI